MGAETKACLVCGQAFEKKAGSEFDMCPSCLKKMGDRYAAQAPENAPTAPRKRIGLWVVLALSVAFNAFQFPRIKQALALLFPPAPEDTSKRPDTKELCIANLWNISSQLQKGLPPSSDMVCPLTKAPYRTETVKGNLVVSCPNPGSHGLKTLRVSKNAPTPEVIPR